MIKLTKEESGYSLVEVLAAIVILSIAIIPMVGMFDAGLRAASSSGNYDKARALANLKLEQARSLPYDSSSTSVTDLKDNFPETAPTTANDYTVCGFGCYRSSYKDPEAAISTQFAGFRYQVEKQYLKQPSTAPSSASEPFQNSLDGTDKGLIKVTVTVRWGSGNEYSTFGMVAK